LKRSVYKIVSHLEDYIQPVLEFISPPVGKLSLRNVSQVAYWCLMVGSGRGECHYIGAGRLTLNISAMPVLS
jgi:hypothetical protein